MELRPLVVRCALLSAAIGLLCAAGLVLGGYPRAAAGLAFGVAIGIVNLTLLALRVVQVGNLTSPSRARRAIQAGMGMRLLMIGLAAALAIKLSATMNVYGMLAGLLLTLVVANILGIRYVLREIW